MKIKELMPLIEAQNDAPGADLEREVLCGYTCDLLSWVMAHGAEGMAWLYLLFILLAGGAWLAWRAAKKVPEDAHSLPYFSGLAEERNGEVGFRGPMNVFEPARAANYYLAQYVGEGKITRAIDIISTAFLIVLVGGLL